MKSKSCLFSIPETQILPQLTSSTSASSEEVLRSASTPARLAPGVERDGAVSAGLHRSEQLVDGRLDLTEVRVLLLQIKRSQQERLGAVAT